MDDNGLETGGDLSAVGVHQQQQQARVTLAHRQHAGNDMQWGSGQGFAHKTNMLIRVDQGGQGAALEGIFKAHDRRQPNECLHDARAIEANVHVAHSVTFPGIDAAAPDLDAPVISNLHLRAITRESWR